MNKKYFRLIWMSVLAVMMSAGLSSCIEDDWFPYEPPAYNDYYYDQYLNGTWRLCEANGIPVRYDEANYLEFYGGGRGRYYEYDDWGNLYAERTAYWCRDVYGSPAGVLTLVYENGDRLDMNYRFRDSGYGDELWLQWNDYYGTQTYVYEYTDRVPW